MTVLACDDASVVWGRPLAFGIGGSPNHAWADKPGAYAFFACSPCVCVSV